MWNWGPKDDFEEIARLVGDRDWDWEHASTQLKKVCEDGFPNEISCLNNRQA